MNQNVYTYNMYKLSQLNKRHETLNLHIQWVQDHIEKARAARYINLRTWDIDQCCDNHVLLNSIEFELTKILDKLLTLRDRVCMEKLKHPDFVM